MKICTNCTERWNKFLIDEQLRKSIMKDGEKKPEENKVADTQKTVVPAKPDVQKVIEDRRKAIESGKQINK